ncbi:hypothetical protein BKM20_01510 [Pseudomonas avellanae]|uniref:EAL domain-containing protein n=1 Tax=Pseudomonas avellanae pv. morsprunorum TaxID=3380385 RepID=A0ABX4Z4U6_9PSED|nr:hypothetical protein AL055_02380 [Pseudomonas amygdali pv. morsprunorum]PHN50887.1 hypothetical protein AO261_02660 [Pseudomonas avellanae]POC97898.1 hypothetical protein BKM26_01510 [Pseudomonas avellanae]POD12429.1 hypothetical protein BKM20_01510 [Pseudomonas avellanae]POD17628.1 hypothetical protein BKM05_21840 [Pseudomonas avellanae]
MNVSGKELSRPGFVDQVTQIIATTGLPAAQLQIEVTESVFLYQPDAIAEVLRQIRHWGVRVALTTLAQATARWATSTATRSMP